jgi:hypothetical protein
VRTCEPPAERVSVRDGHPTVRRNRVIGSSVILAVLMHQVQALSWVACEQGGDADMGRLMLAATVALPMAAMFVIIVAPAFAVTREPDDGDPRLGPA